VQKPLKKLLLLKVKSTLLLGNHTLLQYWIWSWSYKHPDLKEWRYRE